MRKFVGTIGTAVALVTAGVAGIAMPLGWYVSGDATSGWKRLIDAGGIATGAGLIAGAVTLLVMVAWARRQDRQEAISFRPPPDHHPYRPDCVYGRTDAMRRLSQLCATPGVVVVSGPGGIGKSTLCSEFFHESAQRFKGGRRWWADLDQATGDEVEARIARGIGAPTFEEAARKLETGGRSLLFLDNSESAWANSPEGNEPVLDRLFEAARDGATILLSRRGERLPNHPKSRSLTLEPLDQEGARELFLRRAPAHSDDPHLDTLVRWCDGLPLAIDLLARAVAHETSLATIASAVPIAELQKGSGNHREQSLRFSVDLSLNSSRMTDAARALLRVIAALPDGLNPDDINHLAPKIKFPGRAAQTLLDLGLVTEAGAGQRCLHPIRETLSHHLTPELATAFARLAIGKLPGDTDGTWRRKNGANLHTAVVQAGNRPQAKEAVLTLLRNPVGTELPEDWIDPAFAADAEVTSALIDRHQAVASSEIAALRQRVGAYDALIQLYRRIGDQQGEANALRQLGRVDLRRSNYDSAATQSNQALTIYRRIGDQQGEANALRQLGRVDLRRSNYDSATTQSNQALTIYRRIGDQQGEADALQELGRVDLQRSNYDSAETQLNQALTIYRRIGDQQGEANALRQLGRVDLQRDNYDSAATQSNQALTIYRRIGDQQGEADALRQLGRVDLRRSNYDSAETQLNQALTIYRRIGDQQGEADALQELGRVDLQRSNFDSATTQFNQALTIYRRIGDQQGEADALDELGCVDLRRDNYDSAATQSNQALTIYRRIGDQLGEANALRQLGRVDLRRGNYDSATTQFNQALTICRRIGDQQGEANTLHKLGLVDLQRSNFDSATTQFNQALTICRRIGDRLGEAITLYELALLAPDTTRQSLAAAAVRLYEQIGFTRWARQVEVDFDLVVVNETVIDLTRGDPAHHPAPEAEGRLR